MTKTTLERKIRKIIRDNQAPDRFRGGLDLNETRCVIDLVSLFASELKAEKKRWIEKVKEIQEDIHDREVELTGLRADISLSDMVKILDELNEKLTKLEEE